MEKTIVALRATIDAERWAEAARLADFISVAAHELVLDVRKLDRDSR